METNMWLIDRNVHQEGKMEIWLNCKTQRRMYVLYVTHIGGYTTDLTEI